MVKLHVRTGDTVIVLSGKNKGKKGKILSASPADGKVVIENVNMLTMHKKPRKQGDVGGIVKREGALDACKVMLVCPSCGRPSRVGMEILADGTKVRSCKSCGETI